MLADTGDLNRATGITLVHPTARRQVLGDFITPDGPIGSGVAGEQLKVPPARRACFDEPLLFVWFA